MEKGKNENKIIFTILCITILVLCFLSGLTNAKSGAVGQKVKEYKWSSGWSTVEFYNIGGDTYLFLLKKKGWDSDGYNVHIHKMSSSGHVGTLVARYKWTRGWIQA
jgi:hypothetical protein